ncbi:MAG: GNAT family N-acetyltransferase [Myxococcales bacterium]|nr:GNAT family N-acetyltransferase [Myxococcales bacterium]
MSIISTSRLVLRSWNPDDAAPLFAIYSDPEVTRHIPHVHLKDLDAARAKVREMMDLERKNGCTLWAVMREEELIGVCGFRTPDELGFAFRRDAWGNGYAQEAAIACIAWAARRGVRRILASVRPENAGSRRVLDRLGFTDTGKRSEDGLWCIYERLTASAAL